VGVLHLLIYRTFFLSLLSNFVLLLLYCKTASKQGYIHASYQVAEMAFFEYYE